MPQMSLKMMNEAVGADQGLRIAISGGNLPAPQVFELSQPFALIGRAPFADLVLPDAAVSTRHTYLQVIDGRVFGVDLGSRTGTFWDQQRCASGWISCAKPPGRLVHNANLSGGPVGGNVPLQRQLALPARHRPGRLKRVSPLYARAFRRYLATRGAFDQPPDHVGRPPFQLSDSFRRSAGRASPLSRSCSPKMDCGSSICFGKKERNSTGVTFVVT